ncbi:alpha-amylase family protein [Salinimonas chungwhensis]|uniref:alpha-amylase family protein n=1 Tax=Salinimonas chungwhensis TaxID=265425 RepID=UPI000379C8ED|nr:alpha-amylase family protein [Salinimonas chungwhensis]
MQNRSLSQGIFRRSLTGAALTGVMLVSQAQADVILHAFNWQYDDVAEKAEEIAALGYKKVLVSPAYKSTGSQWWARYQPQDYRVIDNPLGDTDDFKAMVAALEAQGVETYADIVFNHMANEASQRSDLNYPGVAVLDEYASRQSYYDRITLFGDVRNGLFSGNDFHGTYDPQGPQCISDYSNVGDVQYNRLCGAAPDPGLPDLDPNNWVVEKQKQYLQALKDFGVTGFRVDAAKHMTNYHINQVFDENIKQGTHVFGEIITTGGAGSAEYDKFLAPYISQTGHDAYDFPLFAQIRNAFGFGGSMTALVDPGAYGQALPGDQAVTFSVTHDIPLNDGFRYQLLDAADEALANAYVLGRDGGSPLLYSDHNESGDGRWQDLYKRDDIEGMISFHNETQGRSMEVINYNDCFLLFKREHVGVVGINKCDTGQDVWVDTSAEGLWWYRNYQDTLSSDVQYISSQWHNFYLPGRSARMWLME